MVRPGEIFVDRLATAHRCGHAECERAREPPLSPRRHESHQRIKNPRHRNHRIHHRQDQDAQGAEIHQGVDKMTGQLPSLARELTAELRSATEAASGDQEGFCAGDFPASTPPHSSLLAAFGSIVWPEVQWPYEANCGPFPDLTEGRDTAR